MTVAFTIPGPLRPFASGESRALLARPARTVSEALEALWTLHPGLKARVLTEQGQVRPHVNIFVDADNIRDLGGLNARIPDSCEIAILPAVSGGIRD